MNGVFPLYADATRVVGTLQEAAVICKLAGTSCALLAMTMAVASARQDWLHVEETKLIGSDTTAADWLGTSVAIDGDTAIVGAPHADPNERGAAYVFVREHGSWSMQAKLVATGTVADFDHFGASVAIDGDTAVVGAPDWSANNSGAVYVFQRAGTSWSAVQALLGTTADRLGTSVALRDDHLAASLPLGGSFSEGKIAIYVDNGGTWVPSGSIASAYQDDDGNMGAHIALSETAPGTYALITSTLLDGVEIYQGSGSSWNYLASIVAQNGGFRGGGVAASSTTLAAGLPYLASSAGRVKVYTISGSVLSLEATLQASDATPGDRFGEALAIDGDVLLVGAPFHGDNFSPDLGAAYVFERTAGVWTQRALLVPSDPGPSDHFGDSLGISAGTIVSGAPYDTNTSGTAAGAAYVIRIGFPSVTYCTSGVSSGACAATMSCTGTPSASLSTPFSIQASNVDGQRFGLVFYSASGPFSAPWGPSSSLCVKAPLQRSAAQDSGGTVGACDGPLVLDWNLFVAQNPSALGQPIGSGREIWTQAWYRDPSSVKTTQLSDALAFVLQP